MITRELKKILSKIYIKDAIFFGIYVYKFIAPEIYLGDSSLSGDILLSPTKGEGPLVRASSPTIIYIGWVKENARGPIEMLLQAGKRVKAIVILIGQK
jgi:hypothetical protein